MIDRAFRLRYTASFHSTRYVFTSPSPIVPDRRQFPRLLHHRLHVLSNARHLLSQLFLPRVRARRRGGGLRARRPRASRTARASPPPRLETHRSRASPRAPSPSSSSSSSSVAVPAGSARALVCLLHLLRFVDSSRLGSTRPWHYSECPIFSFFSFFSLYILALIRRTVGVHILSSQCTSQRSVDACLDDGVSFP